MFGGGFGSAGFGNTQQPQQQQSIFGAQTPATPFGGFGTPAPQQQPTSFGLPAATPTAFGQTQPQGFGTPAQSSIGGFGASTSAAPSAFASQARPAFGAGGSIFGSSTPASGATTGWGQPPASSTTTFGGQSGTTGIFGATPAASTGFGFGSSAPTNTFGVAGQQTMGAFSSATTPGQTAYPPQGTATTPFQPHQEKDGTGIGSVLNVYQNISAMPQYKNWSVEELRLADYQQNRKSATTQSGFGQPSAFGTTSTYGSNQQAPSMFGSTASSAPATGGLFGQPQAGAFSGGFGGASTGGFGSTTTNAFGARPAGSIGIFGNAPATQSPFATTQPPATGFGAPSGANTGFGATAPAFGGSTFGAPANKPAAFGGFGGFGSGTTTSAPAFGAATTAPSLFGTPATPAFGTPQQPAAGGFGTVTSTPFAGFGTTQAAQPATSFAGFGSGPASKPATNAFSFGAPATQTAGTLGAKPAFGFGGVPPTSGFGAPTSAATGLFGQTSQAPTGGLFGGTSQPGGLFGGNTLAAPAATSLGTTGLFGTKPAGSLLSAPTTTPTFNLSGTQTGGTSTGFGMGSSTAMGGLGSLGTSNMAASAATGPLLQASINQNAYGQNPLFSTPTRPKANIGPVATPVQAATPGADLSIRPAAKRTALLANYKITPKSASKIKLRGFTSSTPSTASPSSSPSAKSYHLFDGQSEDQYLSPDTFVPRRSVKKLVIEQQPTLSSTNTSVAHGSTSKSLYPTTNANDRIRNSIEPSLEIEAEQSNVNRANEAFAKATSMSHMTPQRGTTISPISRISPSPMASSSDATQSKSPSNSPAPKGTYWTSPSLPNLRKLTQDQLRAVKNFRVGRIGYGQVTFLDTVDLTEVTEGLEAILGEIVTFEKRVCTVYPNDETKPEVGHGLNVPAVISLEECWFVDKATREVVKDSSDFRAQRQLNRLRNHRDTEFIEFLDNTGTWVFRVEHFSKYGLADDDDNEPVEPSRPQTTSTMPLGNRNVESPNQNRNKVAFFNQPSEAQRSVPVRQSADEDVNAPIGRDLYAEEGNDREEEVFVEYVNEEAAGEMALEENMESDDHFHQDDVLEDDGEADADSDSDILVQQMEGTEYDQEAHPYPVVPTVARPWAQQLGLTARNVQVKQASLFGSSYMPKQHELKTSGFQGRGFGDIGTGAESQFLSKRPGSISEDSQSDDSDAQVPVSHYAPAPKLSSRPPRKFTRVGYESSILFDKSRELADAGLMMNRSFRVGWGPGGKIVHCGQICGWKDLFDQNQDNHAGNDLATKANVCLEDICIFGQNEGMERERHSITLRAQLNKCGIIGDRHAVPGVSYSKDASFDHFVRAVEASSDDVFDNAEKLLWNLGAALWDDIPMAEEFATLATPQRLTVEAIARKDAVGNWLQNAVRNSALKDVEKVAMGSESAAAKAFYYLTAHMVGPACVAAKDGKDFRLATLIAQEGTDETGRELVAEQIKRWNELRVMPHIPLPHRRLYELLSGNTELATVEDGQTKRFHVAEKLDWKRCFGLNLWYGLRPHDPLQECLKQYDSSWMQSIQAEPNFRVAPPVPWYAENARNRSTNVDEQPRDMFWELLHLAVDGARPLDSSCLPGGITPHLLNYRFAWLLHCVLGRSLEVRNFRDAEQNVASNLAESVTASLAFQLEHLGMWEWAIFVRMHHFDSESRTIAIQHLLCRNVPSASAIEEFDEEEISDWNETQTFLLERLLIPQVWIHEASALRARYENQVYDETMALLDAGHYNAAHKLIVMVLAPDLIISGNHNELRKLLGRVDPSEVKDWNMEGEMYLEYISCMEETPSLLFQLQAAGELPHVIVEVKIRLGQLLERLGKVSSKPTQVLPFGGSSLKKLGRTRSVCLAEMATHVSKLMQTVEALCRAGPPAPENEILFGSLALPEDQRLSRLHRLTNNYFNHLASYDEIAAI